MEGAMRWMNIYLLGYLIVVIGVFAALWKLGILQNIGTTWTVIGLIIALGLGIMFAVSGSGEKKTIEVERR
jgi:hypothetical protein